MHQRSHDPIRTKSIENPYNYDQLEQGVFIPPPRPVSHSKSTSTAEYKHQRTRSQPGFKSFIAPPQQTPSSHFQAEETELLASASDGDGEGDDPNMSGSSPPSLGHTRRRSIILSPTLGNFPFSEEGIARQRRQSNFNSSTSGTGIGGGGGMEEKLSTRGGGESNGNSHSVGLGLGSLGEKDESEEPKGLVGAGAGYGNAKGDEVLDRARKEEGAGGEGLTGKDRDAFVLLTCLYLLQGIPIGLTFGTLPFLLKPHLSYSQLALFSLSSWPYSLKLLWSPIVDAWFWNNSVMGRRKSWIVPVQLVLGGGMWWVGGRVQGWIDAEEIDVKFFTMLFILFIFFAATQDIAVDGWALTLLSGPNLSYASTAQTMGISIGATLSNTVFLALNSVEFSNRWLRAVPSAEPAITLEGYLKFWAGVYLVFTGWLVLGKREEVTSEDDPDLDVRKVYRVMGSILKLKNIQSFLIVHLVAKFGFQALEITSFKLMEKGLRKEDFALVNLLNTPFELVGASIAANWSRGERPLAAWEKAFWPRYAMAVVAAGLVWWFPSEGVGNGYLGVVVVTTLLASFASTIQFVGVQAFHTQIADPIIGGTYMTLLNTISNLGGTWPKPLVLRGIDYFSESTCRIKEETGQVVAVRAAECTSDHGRAMCEQVGGICTTERDGYYAMSAICVIVGVIVLVTYVKPTARRLQSLPVSAWRVKIPE